MKDTKSPGQQLIMLFALSICCMFIGQGLAQILVKASIQDGILDPAKNPNIMMLSIGVTHLFTHVIVFFSFLRISSLTWNEVFEPVKIKGGYLVAIPLLGFVCLLLIEGMTAWSHTFFENGGLYEAIELDQAHQKALMPLLMHHDPWQLVLSLFVFAVLPAFGEEFIYRGILQSKLVEATRNGHFSVFVSAIIFSAMHFQPLNLLAIAFMGIVLGYLFLFTKSIWYGVILHFTINAAQILLLYFIP